MGAGAARAYPSPISLHLSPASERMDHPLRHAQAGVERIPAYHRAVAGGVHQKIRHAVRRRDLHGIELAVDAVLLHLVFAPGGDGHLRFERRIGYEAGRGRGRLGQGLQIWRLLRGERKRNSEEGYREQAAHGRASGWVYRRALILADSGSIPEVEHTLPFRWQLR